ncbi:MAG: alpha/beta fold hydrolase [Staphylothermus sp.]|nr:alpha/beta fold hydrolase [Staphylothermus sp.]
MNKNEFRGFYSELAEKLCFRGFASLRFDFRGHGESEGYQREFSVIEQILDIKASIKEISKIWKGPISIIATSFGAGATIIYTALYGSRINTLILISPVIDYVATFLKPTTPWTKEEFSKERMKTLETNGYLELNGTFDIGAKLVEELKLIKPYEYIKMLKIPVLTIHGDKDTMVPFRSFKNIWNT